MPPKRKPRPTIVYLAGSIKAGLPRHMIFPEVQHVAGSFSRAKESMDAQIHESWPDPGEVHDYLFAIFEWVVDGHNVDPRHWWFSYPEERWVEVPQLAERR